MRKPAALALLLAACQSPPPNQVMEITDLGPGHRNRIRVLATASNATPDDCRALAKHYGIDAGTDGQVVVHRGPARRIWCVDNRDGSPVLFPD